MVPLNLPARPHGREEAPTCGGDRRSRALASPGEGCRVSDVDWGRQPRRGPLFRRAPLFQLPQRGAPASRSRGMGAVVEHGVRGVARARSEVAIAGRRDVSQRSGRRPALLRPGRPTFTCTSSTRWISTGLSRSGGPAPLAKCCSRMRSSRRCRRSDALNVLLAAYSLAAPLWQVAHPPQRLIGAFAEEPEVPPDWNLDFASALVSSPNPLSKPQLTTRCGSTTRTSWRHGRTWPSCHSAPDRTVVSVRRWAICRCNSCSPSFADPCPESEAVFARGTPEHRTSSSSRAPCLPGSETPQPNPSLLVTAGSHHRQNPAPRTSYRGV